MRVAVSAGEAAGIVETVPNGCGRTPGGGPGRTGQSVGASAVPAKPGRGRGPDRDQVADQRRQRGGALTVLLAAVALLTVRLRKPSPVGHHQTVQGRAALLADSRLQPRPLGHEIGKESCSATGGRTDK